MTTSCPGCGAPQADPCRYCGRRAGADYWRDPCAPYYNLRYLPPPFCTMSNGEPYIPPGRKPEPPVGFWRALLGWLP